MNRLCVRLGIRIPIIQAPIGKNSNPELAAAVSTAGGLGSVGVTWSYPDEVRDVIARVRHLSDGPFMVNLVLTWPPEEQLRACLDAGVPLVGFSFGDPSPYVDRVRTAGALVAAQTGTVGGALRAAEAGIDVVILQGLEAGGHVQSTTPLARLVPAVAAALSNYDTVIVAAGGLATGEDIARVIDWGADGAMLGTRFVATEECISHPDYKRRVVQADADDTVYTVAFNLGWPETPHRVLRNSTLNAWETAGCPPSGSRPGEGDVVATNESGGEVIRYAVTAPRAGMTGAVEAMALYAGTGCGKIRDIPRAGDLVRRLWDEAKMRLGHVPAAQTPADPRSP